MSWASDKAREVADDIFIGDHDRVVVEEAIRRTIRACASVVMKEKLHGPATEEDLAYDRAVEDCVAAIRKLGEPSGDPGHPASSDAGVNAGSHFLVGEESDGLLRNAPDGETYVMRSLVGLAMPVESLDAFLRRVAEPHVKRYLPTGPVGATVEMMMLAMDLAVVCRELRARVDAELGGAARDATDSPPTKGDAPT